ncbi:hypothetical protein [Undibacterium sp.]|uniref:hypothetical protein n=1 Tax=Undibacterium sp. TaxID=1914977 RepID=UPI0025D5C320|nr:hypothetical protein [Undibacterium sp.]
MKLVKWALLYAVLASTNAMALNASSLKLKVYAIMLSTSPLCTNPFTVFSSIGTEVDFLTSPTLGSGNPPDGTYNCVIIKMSDNIKFTPSTSGGACVGGTEYVAETCSTNNHGTSNAPDVATVSTCTGTDAAPVPDIVYLYLSTNPLAGTGGNTFLQPGNTSSTSGIHLSAPLVIAGSARSKFVVNATGSVDGTSGGSCGMNPPAFGFQKL